MFKLSDVLDVDQGRVVRLVGGKAFWHQIQKLHFLIPIFVNYNLSVEVLCKPEESFFLSQVVHKNEEPVAFVSFHDVVETLIRFRFGRKIILRVRKSVIQVQVVHVNCDSALSVAPAPLRRAQVRVIEHLLVEAEIARVQHSAHLALEEEHDRARTVIRVHEHDRQALLFLLVDVDPVFLIELQFNHEVL